MHVTSHYVVFDWPDEQCDVAIDSRWHLDSATGTEYMVLSISMLSPIQPSQEHLACRCSYCLVIQSDRLQSKFDDGEAGAKCNIDDYTATSYPPNDYHKSDDRSR